MFVLLCLRYFIFSYSAIFAASLIKRSVQFSSVHNSNYSHWVHICIIVSLTKCRQNVCFWKCPVCPVSVCLMSLNTTCARCYPTSMHATCDVSWCYDLVVRDVDVPYNTGSYKIFNIKTHDILGQSPNLHRWHLPIKTCTENP